MDGIAANRDELRNGKICEARYHFQDSCETGAGRHPLPASTAVHVPRHVSRGPPSARPRYLIVPSRLTRCASIDRRHRRKRTPQLASS